MDGQFGRKQGRESMTVERTMRTETVVSLTGAGVVNREGARGMGWIGEAR